MLLNAQSCSELGSKHPTTLVSTSHKSSILTKRPFTCTPWGFIHNFHFENSLTNCPDTIQSDMILKTILISYTKNLTDKASVL